MAWEDPQEKSASALSVLRPATVQKMRPFSVKNPVNIGRTMDNGDHD